MWVAVEGKKRHDRYPHKTIQEEVFRVGSCRRIRLPTPTRSRRRRHIGCCAIDYMSRYYSGDPQHSMNRAKYVAFLRHYFSPSYDPSEFYGFVRSGLLHGYNMNRRYVVVGSGALWARRLHMQYDAKHRATLINPFAFYGDIRTAFRQYIADLDADPTVFEKFVAVWSESSFERPQLSSDWNKFKHLSKEPR